MAMPAPSTSRQFGIWQSRVYRECHKCAHVEEECAGVSFRELCVEESEGVAVAHFHCFVPFREGSSALSMVPLIALEIDMSYGAAQGERGEPQYPFRAPIVRVYEGLEHVPRELRQGALLQLPTLAQWTPSNTLLMILQDFVRAIQESDPQPAAGEATAGSDVYGASTGNKRLRLRKRDVHNVIYQCQEVDPRTGLLRTVPLLLQSSSVVFLAPPARSAPSRVQARPQRTDADEYLYVEDLIQLKDIARITPQRGKSITFFFKRHSDRCRTLLTPDTEAIVADIKRMIATVGSKRARDEGAQSRSSGYPGSSTTTPSNRNDEYGGGSFSDLLSYLTPTPVQTEKAKEVSNKIVGKLSKWGSSMSRFLRGDDEDEHAYQGSGRGVPNGGPGARNDSVFQEIHQLRATYFRHPSRARLVEITTRYQQLAESCTRSNTRDERVERAIGELQEFIEHPTSQQILLEASSADQSNRGIRVGPS